MLQWGGIRGTLGVIKGQYYFKVRLHKEVVSSHPRLPKTPEGVTWPEQLHAAGIGVSQLAARVALLGKDKKSWCYDSSGGISAEGAPNCEQLCLLQRL